MRTFDFSPLFRSTVGFDRLFDLMDSVAEQSNGYPPYNIERSDETHYRISLAVAGFGEKDLSIEIKEGVLTVTGQRSAEDPSQARAYLYQGIAGRAFERRFQLADHVEVKAAYLENGLLHIDLERLIPEEKKPRRIAISAQDEKSPGLKTIEGKAA
jgi:Molecular chaperone (small heat shock protein)